eukprot:TRINITY_DN68093_c0_g2_i1.p1 TRINITY_DN68093_c0_g2~~TRINITY_DN68093_c0_g2_i1.p1  ORF type:complete len:629 (-),score=311.97 TRINITY_DN68093_c0_g2_i1:1747-3447(-)
MKTKVVYTGPNTSFVVRDLPPVSDYTFRVQAHNRYGAGLVSDVCVGRTKAFTPAAPDSVHVSHVRARQFTLVVGPVDDRGASIKSFQVDLNGDITTHSLGNASSPSSSSTAIVFRDLVPTTKYVARVRAVNKMGHGPWSDAVEANTLVALPPRGKRPTLIEATQTSLRVRVKLLDKPDVRSELAIADAHAHAHAGGNERVIVCDSKDGGAVLIDDGLKRGTSYQLRLRHVNSAGPGEWSVALRATTATTAPNAPGNVRVVDAGGKWLRLEWDSAEADGVPVTSYTVHVCEDPSRSAGQSKKARKRRVAAVASSALPFRRAYSGAATRARLKALKPFTSYLLRVMAVNEVGSSPPTELSAATVGVAPTAPHAPAVSTKDKSDDEHVHVDWSVAARKGGRRQQVDVYVLEGRSVVDAELQQHQQQNQQPNNHSHHHHSAAPFAPLYTGAAHEATVPLNGADVMELRLIARNAFGDSHPSQSIKYRTPRAIAAAKTAKAAAEAEKQRRAAEARRDDGDAVASSVAAAPGVHNLIASKNKRSNDTDVYTWILAGVVVLVALAVALMFDVI